jgi:hypothetical protein
MGGILDSAIQVFRAKLALFAGLALFPGLVQWASEIASVHPQSTTDPSGAQLALVITSYGASLVLMIANFVVGAVTTAAICFAASKVIFDENVTIRAAFAPFTSHAGRLVGLEFLQGLFAGWPLILVAFVATGVTAMGGPIYLLIPVWVLGSILCIALYCRYALSFPATAVEDLTATSAIERSIRLSEGGRWRVCGGFLFPGLLGAGFTFGSSWLIKLLASASPWLTGSPVTVAGLDGAVTLIASLIFMPIGAIVLTVLYYDQRIRREGYDIERMMDEAGMSAPTTPPAEGGSIAVNPISAGPIASTAQEGKI